MAERRKIKIIQWIIIIVLAVSVAVTLLFHEQQLCMGVKLISESKLEKYSSGLEIDLNEIVFQGESVAADVEERVIYISQSADSLWHSFALKGKLESRNPRHKLYFIKNEAMEELSDTVKKGVPLSLVILSGNTKEVIDVVISTLPILKLDGNIVGEDEEERDILKGKVSLWAGCDPGTGNYSVKTSELTWRKRGNITAREPKNSWKLKLWEKEEKRNLEFLGMGSDDDWILNSMVKDDTKIKEKLFMEMWNELSETTEYNLKMSTGEYVEAVINGDYMGLYLLQRRLDAKYLDLDEDKILLKATQNWATTTEEAYEIVQGAEKSEEIYAFMQRIFELSDCSSINVDNLIDVNIILLLMNAVDNGGYKNMYFLLEESAEGYDITLIPWDTDVALGIVWIVEADDFAYDYQRALIDYAQRRETKSVKETEPKYDEKIYLRWEELKKTNFSLENIYQKVDSIEETITFSSSMDRETERWEYKYAGEDNIDNLKNFIKERQEQMDIIYALE